MIMDSIALSLYSLPGSPIKLVPFLPDDVAHTQELERQRVVRLNLFFRLHLYLLSDNFDTLLPSFVVGGVRLLINGERKYAKEIRFVYSFFSLPRITTDVRSL